ncbi:uncharacterized protein BDV17DRAFT_30651 [Aspergillus undulatus]|uniref:uncharacterized protein n=1 Tax=Aspergillus undulatus TaxID=1810928 RepID=UPI003CCE1673
MAISKVLLLPELFEPILAEPSQRDLLQAQRVSRGWNEFIAHSKRLQHKLFFQPERICPQTATNVTVEINPILKEFFPPFFEGSEAFNDDPYSDEEDEDENGNRCLHHYEDYCRVDGAEIIRYQPWYKDEEKRKAVLNPDASWRRMYLSNPPGRIDELEVDMPGYNCSTDHLDGRLCKRYRAMNRNPGPRMGLIWDVVAFILDNLPTGEFSIWWWRRRDGNDSASENGSWFLGWHLLTFHTWSCYDAREGYGPSGLKVVDDGDIVEYKDYDKYMGNIWQREAPLNSVLDKYVRRRKAIEDFNDRLEEALKANTGHDQMSGGKDTNCRRDSKVIDKEEDSDDEDGDEENGDTEDCDKDGDIEASDKEDSDEDSDKGSDEYSDEDYTDNTGDTTAYRSKLFRTKKTKPRMKRNDHSSST